MALSDRTIARLAAALAAANLGGADAHATAAAELARLAAPDGTDAHAANNAIVLFAVRGGYAHGLLATAAPDAGRAVLARLIAAGGTDDEIAELLAVPLREAA
jgi:hypothetical protein